MRMNPHIKRWATGVVVVPLLFALIAYGSAGMFNLLIVMVTLAGVAEYNRMLFGRGLSLEKVETFLAAMLILWAAVVGDRIFLLTLLSFSVMAILMLNLLSARRGLPDIDRVGRVLLGVMYVPLLMSHFILIRQTASGILWIFFILIMAFCGDIAAYYIGRRLGRRKLLPEVSPGKTVEGTIGLIAGSVAGALIFGQFFFPGVSIVHVMILGIVGSVTGQLGDLCESSIKRVAGVKDSGTLLPGHGGILDRLDCLMFITPFVYYYRVFIIQ
jgi:phosphatidate cytidylyltransferase